MITDVVLNIPSEQKSYICFNSFNPFDCIKDICLILVLNTYYNLMTQLCLNLYFLTATFYSGKVTQFSTQ